MEVDDLALDEFVGEPVKALIETSALVGASRLNVPLWW